ncbi:MAG: DUF4105 domain-containing protein [Myxococcaceae bacterium]|nr:DUF4105 domain-containing protein [Myxococcaceae bacterium]
MLPLTAALVLALAPAPWGTGESQGEDLVIEMTTFGPGDTLTEWWGHSALVVRDTRLHQERLYNYGMFGFSTGFVHKFVQGRLEFWVEDTPYVVGTYRMYEGLNRFVHIQELNLLPAQRLVLAKALADNVLPQNREYLYQHYHDNCSTRPRDLIDKAVGGQLREWSKQPGRMTIRNHTRRYSSVSPPMSLVLDYLQNDELDGPVTLGDEAFLPDELERQLDTFQVKRDDGTLAPLVAKKTVWFEAKREPTPQEPVRWGLWLFLTGLAVALVGHALGHWGRDGARLPRVLLGLFTTVLGLGQGVMGVFLFVVGIFTDHTVAHRNENLFLVNPITFALFPLGLMLIFGSTRARNGLKWTWSALAALGALGVLCKVLPAFDQANWNLNLLELPVTFGFAALWWLDARYRAAR